MSRIGKQIITIPDKVTVKQNGAEIEVKGPKGELRTEFLDFVGFEISEKEITVTRKDETKQSRSIHGLSRALLNNMVIGVSEGYSKTLEIVGVGYRAELKGTNLLLNLGYSHPIYFMPPDGITFECPNPNTIIISGIDKQLVGQVAAKIRSFKKPEPYKGKGVKYQGEYIRRKAGKTAG